ncbi:MAG: ABC transporter permease [Bacteroidota bacterium]
MKKFQPLNLLFAFLGGLVLLFIIAPLVGLVIATSPVEIIETSKDSEVQYSIWLTLWTSMLATIVFAVAAIPLSYLLARKNFPLKRLVLAIIDLPIVIPHSAAGIAILGFISRDSVIGKTASLFGLNFVGHPAGIAVAMAFVSIPFLINAARDGFAGVPERLEKAALNLGASSIRVFFTISLPLAWRNIISGLVMMFARGMSEFGAVVIVAYHPMVTPILIFERFGAFGLKYARPVSVVFIGVCLIFFIALRLLSREGGKKYEVRSMR